MRRYTVNGAAVAPLVACGSRRLAARNVRAKAKTPLLSEKSQLRSKPLALIPSSRRPSASAPRRYSDPTMAAPPGDAKFAPSRRCPGPPGGKETQPVANVTPPVSSSGSMQRRAGQRHLPEALYARGAEAYDIVHATKPYHEEAATVRELALQGAPRPYRSLLDVACGSGRHLEQFSRWFDCEGVDASPVMLARARSRVSRARFSLGRMESFDLGRQFDVVTCLFSAIAYVRSVGALRRTVRNLARHTAPGGVVLVEPWLTPAMFRDGLVHHLVAQARGTTVLRMNSTRRHGSRSIFDFHYLVGRRGRVDHFVEVHDLGLFDRRTMTAAFRDAGLTVRYVPGGLSTGRGLYVARRPPLAPDGNGRRTTAGRSRPRATR